MSTNVAPEFSKAQGKYLKAKTDEERLPALEEMIKTMPQHKSAEAMRANLRTRLKKLRERLEQGKKKKTGRKEGIRKEGVQVVLIGLTSSGKSSILSILTNAKPEIAPYAFTTKYTLVGALDYKGIKFQIIDMPAVNYETFDQGIANAGDILLIVIEKTEDIELILPFLKKSTGKIAIAFNKIDLLNSEERRKVDARLKSKRFQFRMISCKTKENIEELKEMLFQNSGVIRIYTKEPRKPTSFEPVIMPVNSTVTNLAEKIFKKKTKVKEARVTGPSSKFPDQKVSITHILKDKDIVEFYTE